MELRLPTWGGRRKGAGRKPTGEKAGVSHLRRPRFSKHHPVHVTMRTLPHVGYLRGQRRFRAIEAALRDAKQRFDVRIIHFSVQGNHLHLLVEADDVTSLARAVQGLAIRLAKALNGVARRTGKVFADRYHSHVLKTRREVAGALRYILENFRHHLRAEEARRHPVDPCSSAAWLTIGLTGGAPVVAPRTWLLRHAGRTGPQCTTASSQGTPSASRAARNASPYPSPSFQKSPRGT